MADTAPKENCNQAETTLGCEPGALLDSASSAGLRFFGRMSASISHELKNTLSIMNESAGLIEDLALMAERGRALDASRVKSLSATIKRQIQRTDQIIRNMNRFSHSVDEPLKEVELVDFLDFILTISRRLTATKGVAVGLHSRDRPIRVVTRPFFLHSMLWRLLEFGMQSAGTSKELTITPVKSEPEIEIRIDGMDAVEPAAGRDFPTPPDRRLLALLEAEFRIDFNAKALSLVLPQRIRDGRHG